MEGQCFQCGNCKLNEPTYYCPAKDKILVNELYRPAPKNKRAGWKEGAPGYENHRREIRKE